MSREALLARTLVELADTLVDDFDVVELLTLLTDRCVEVLDVAAAGLMLGYPGGDLRVMASSSDAMRLLELFELQSSEGPCPDCYRTGVPIVNHRLDPSGGPWPRFGPRALEAGFRSVHALPMRLRDVTIGALNLFRTDEGALNDADVLAAQALADVATIAVLHHRAVSDTKVVNEQLHHALNSRIVIEQAKGMVAERAGLDMDHAFSALRNHARSHNLRLVGVAHDVIDGALPAASLRAAPPLPSPRRAAAAREPLTDALAALAGIAPVLDMVEAAAPVDAVEVVAGDLAVTLDADEISFLIADLGGDSLIRFVRPSHGRRRQRGAPEQLEKVAMAGTPYQRALVSQVVQVVPDGDRHRLFAPVTDRGDALGVLELVVGTRPDDALVKKVASAAHALAYVVIASRRHTDLFESVQRNARFSLAAEIQQRLMPSAFTCEAEQFTFAGWLEPASHVGGDTFDYSVDRDALHVSMTDAMGRGVKAALLATLAVGSLRNSRQAGVGLAEQARRANDAMTSNADEDQFITGLLLKVDLRSGRVIAVNAGHPQPYRLRAGRVDRLELDADIPFGMIAGSSYREQALHLAPGDRLVVVTDGLLERNEAAGHLDVAAAIVETAALHPREVVHAFKASVVAAAQAELDDDAAVLCIDWHGSRSLHTGGLGVAGPSGTGRRDATDAA
ncbi:MAG: SpoIIE family protein phosphatase [Actinomycetota bacterium]|nr:SpoIIE family protein phosphatase [Actinomycetota bacterium]